MSLYLILYLPVLPVSSGIFLCIFCTITGTDGFTTNNWLSTPIIPVQATILQRLRHALVGHGFGLGDVDGNASDPFCPGNLGAVWPAKLTGEDPWTPLQFESCSPPCPKTRGFWRSSRPAFGRRQPRVTAAAALPWDRAGPRAGPESLLPPTPPPGEPTLRRRWMRHHKALRQTDARPSSVR